MPPAEGLERFRIEVGHVHEVQPGNIVGAIANEAGLDGQHIGHIKIFDDYSLVDLPMGMPKDVFNDLKKVRVAGQALKITRLGGDDKPEAAGNKAADKKPEPRVKLKPKVRSKDKDKGKPKKPAARKVLKKEAAKS